MTNEDKMLDVQKTIDELKKAKDEIDKQYKWLMQTKLTLYDIDIAFSAIKQNRDNLLEEIKALGEDIRIAQKAITDEKVLIGFNMALALCNKHLGEVSK